MKLVSYAGFWKGQCKSGHFIKNLKVLVSCSHFICVEVLVEEGEVLVGKCRSYVSCWFLEGMVSERVLHPFLRSRYQAF